jgi:F-type H+-transporting ATPase subunit epsilon
VAKHFRCTIVTPSEAVFDEEVSYVSLPAWDGQRGVMFGQSPVLTQLGIGPLRVELADGKTRWFLLDGGFAQIHYSTVTLLTERATAAEDLSAAEAERELSAANTEVVAQGHTSAADRTRLEAAQQRAQAKKALAQARG